MLLTGENRRGISRSLHWTGIPRVIVAIFLLAGLTAHSPGQLPNRLPARSSKDKPTATHVAPSATTPAAGPTASPTGPIDSIGRETPRSAMIGLWMYGAQQDFTRAARYLQPTPGQDTDLPRRARELQALRSHFEGDIALLSDEPNGDVEPGLPLGHVRAGVLIVGDTTTDVILVRADDPASGKIWTISKETVAKIPELYAQMQSEAPTSADDVLPAVVTRPQPLGISAGQWLGGLLSIPICWMLAWLSTFLFSARGRVLSKLRKLPFWTVWQTPLGLPLRCILAILLHIFFVYQQLQLPILYRAFYLRLMAGLLAGCFVWLMIRIADRGFDHAINHVRLQSRGRKSILILVQRLTHLKVAGYWFSWISTSLFQSIFRRGDPKVPSLVYAACNLVPTVMASVEIESCQPVPHPEQKGWG